MRTLPIFLCVSLLAGLAGEAQAAKKKKHHAAPHKATPVEAASPAESPGSEGDANEGNDGRAGAEDSSAAVPGKPAKKPADGKKALDFDFFGDKPGQGADGRAGSAGTDLSAEDADAKSHTRRWMLKTHQVLGITTWALLAGTVVVGQLNYNQLYGGGGGSPKWQTPHRWLVLSTSVMFATTAAFSIFAPSPYEKPLRFDTGLIHRIAVIGATLGMLTEGVLGWVTTHQANAGNPNNLRTMARTHQIVGYSTLGFLTVAGAVWIF
jgi:hypothetical protein